VKPDGKIVNNYEVLTSTAVAHEEILEFFHPHLLLQNWRLPKKSKIAFLVIPAKAGVQ
jgi:hypothetical protein